MMNTENAKKEIKMTKLEMAEALNRVVDRYAGIAETTNVFMLSQLTYAELENMMDAYGLR